MSNRPGGTLWCLLLLSFGLAPGCGGSSEAVTDAGVDGGFRGFVMLERWERADPPAAHAIAAFLTYHDESGPLPRYVDVDEHCGAHEGIWTGTAEPGYGSAVFTAPGVGGITITEDSAYSTPAGLAAWDTGDMLRVTAPGGDLPGFDLVDAVPARAVLTSHDLEVLAAGELAVRRTEPFALTWSPVDTEVFALILQFDVAADLLRGVWCFFPGGPGSATISPEVLGHLLSSTDVTNTNFYFAGASRQHVTLDRADVQMVTWNGRAARILVL